MPEGEVIPPLTPESGPGKLQTYIHEGLDLIIAEKFDKASEHFYNPQPLENVNIYLVHGVAQFMFPQTFQYPEEVKQTINEQAYQSYVMLKTENTPNTVVTLGYAGIAPDFVLGDKSQYKTIPREIWLNLQKNVALVNAEEWLHALIHTTGHHLIDDSLDEEIDIAIYLDRYNQNLLTDEFLGRYGRREAVEKDRQQRAQQP